MIFKNNDDSIGLPIMTDEEAGGGCGAVAMGVGSVVTGGGSVPTGPTVDCARSMKLMIDSETMTFKISNYK